MGSPTIAFRVIPGVGVPEADPDGVSTGEQVLAWLTEHDVVQRMKNRIDNTLAAFDRGSRIKGLIEIALVGTGKGDNPDQARASSEKRDTVMRDPEAFHASAKAVLERAAVNPRSGTRRPTVAEVDDLINRHQEMWNAQILQWVLDTAHSPDPKRRIDPSAPEWPGTYTARVQHSAEYGKILVLTYEPGRFDMLGYVRERAGMGPDSEPGLLDFNTAAQASMINEWGGGSETVDPRFERLNDALLTDAGFSLTDLIGVWMVIHEECPAGQLTMKSEDRIQTLYDPARGERHGRAGKAFQALTMRCDTLTLDDLSGANREQEVSLTTHPILHTEHGYWIVPEFVIHAGNRYLTDLRFGDWPATKKALETKWPTFARALRGESKTDKTQRELRGAEFEDVVGHHIDALGLPWGCYGSKHGKQHLTPTVRIEGEIDHLVVDSRARIIWVLEDKDKIETGLPWHACNVVREFMRPGGFSDKVAANVDAIRRDPQGVAALVLTDHHLPTPAEGEWEVRSALVIRNGGPMLFFDSRALPHAVLTADMVRAHLRSPSPAP